ncbi:uncharacterized protein I303_102359 [Kwoniella dejecticola CBS 10117]|uniref:Uncharacterized protein n=1 Tax=Kwoniella dejecticola CBS 10117 TaxID=1296121 RepID=A0A1A6AB71_9TREE|nr:uncharacterized protein I303_01501 [Kwoniella dejecticola CBS 10117]OBR87299.1 hypothetical protein I303_01501 [Kwoniella dejecticola CBS 10117]
MSGRIPGDSRGRPHRVGESFTDSRPRPSVSPNRQNAFEQDLFAGTIHDNSNTVRTQSLNKTFDIAHIHAQAGQVLPSSMEHSDPAVQPYGYSYFPSSHQGGYNAQTGNHQPCNPNYQLLYPQYNSSGHINQYFGMTAEQIGNSNAHWDGSSVYPIPGEVSNPYPRQVLHSGEASQLDLAGYDINVALEEEEEEEEEEPSVPFQAEGQAYQTDAAARQSQETATGLSLEQMQELRSYYNMWEGLAAHLRQGGAVGERYLPAAQLGEDLNDYLSTIKDLFEDRPHDFPNSIDFPRLANYRALADDWCSQSPDLITMNERANQTLRDWRLSDVHTLLADPLDNVSINRVGRLNYYHNPNSVFYQLTTASNHRAGSNVKRLQPYRELRQCSADTVASSKEEHLQVYSPVSKKKIKEALQSLKTDAPDYLKEIESTECLLKGWEVETASKRKNRR